MARANPMLERAARAELEEVRQMVDAGDINTAVPRLVQILSNYPGTTSANDARFLLGVSHYRLSSYRDSIQMFREYLRMTPDGVHAADAQTYIDKLTQEYERRFGSPDRLDANVDALIKELQSAPDQPEKQVQLADLLWRRGDFENAGRIYDTILRRRPEYSSDATIASRFERLPDNTYMLLTPTEIQRREKEMKPLQVINLNGFRDVRSNLYREERAFVVSGQVLNQSESVLYGVQVIVTIYGFGNIVYDTQTVNIGRLYPEERRAFSARLTSFDNIENIQRHEAIVTFDH